MNEKEENKEGIDKKPQLTSEACKKIIQEYEESKERTNILQLVKEFMTEMRNKESKEKTDVFQLVENFISEMRKGNKTSSRAVKISLFLGLLMGAIAGCNLSLYKKNLELQYSPVINVSIRGNDENAYIAIKNLGKEDADILDYKIIFVHENKVKKFAIEEKHLRRDLKKEKIPTGPYVYRWFFDNTAKKDTVPDKLKGDEYIYCVGYIKTKNAFKTSGGKLHSFGFMRSDIEEDDTDKRIWLEKPEILQWKEIKRLVNQ